MVNCLCTRPYQLSTASSSITATTVPRPLPLTHFTPNINHHRPPIWVSFMSRRLRSASGQPPRSNSRLPAPSEVIVISSDEDDHQSMPQRKRARREGKSVASSRAPAASSKNPIVISSDDDTPRRRKKSASVTELEMKLKALEEVR